MRSRGPRKVMCAAVVAALFSVLIASPAPAASEAVKLQETRKQIADIKSKLAAAQGKAIKIEGEVKRLDSEIASLDKQISTGQYDISSLESDLRSGQTQIGVLESRYRQAANASNERARRLYVQGPAEAVALLFSAGSPMEAARMQFWMEKSSEQDSKVIVDTARLKSDLTAKQNELNTIKTDLNAQRNWLKQRKDLANAARNERAAALKSVEKEIAQSKAHIEGLQADSDRLQAALKTQASKSSGEGGSSDGAGSKGGFSRPVSGAVTSRFGSRWGRLHAGMDIDGNTGDPIRAVKGGTVLGVGCGSGYGICTLIDHGGGVVTLYAHMSRKAVTGGTVSGGQVIGYVGCTGSCTGSSLHLEVRVNGKPQNPARYI